MRSGWSNAKKAVGTLRLRFGVESAFDYMVGEKLLNFAAAAANEAFAQALPQFVSRVGTDTGGDYDDLAFAL